MIGPHWVFFCAVDARDDERTPRPPPHSATVSHADTIRPMSDAHAVPTPQLTADEVRKVALLARLALNDAQVDRYRHQLAGVLVLVDQLRGLDLADVEPMTHPGGQVNRLDDDADSPAHQRTTLTPEALAHIAPQTDGPFVVIPKVIADGGDA